MLNSAINLRLFSCCPLFLCLTVHRRHGLTVQLMAAALIDDWSLADIGVAEQHQVDVSELRGLDDWSDQLTLILMLPTFSVPYSTQASRTHCSAYGCRAERRLVARRHWCRRAASGRYFRAALDVSLPRPNTTFFSPNIYRIRTVLSVLLD